MKRSLLPYVFICAFLGFPFCAMALPENYAARNIQFMPRLLPSREKTSCCSTDPAHTMVQLLVLCTDGSLHLLTSGTKEFKSKLLGIRWGNPPKGKLGWFPWMAFSGPDFPWRRNTSHLANSHAMTLFMTKRHYIAVGGCPNIWQAKISNVLIWKEGWELESTLVAKWGCFLKQFKNVVHS